VLSVTAIQCVGTECTAPRSDFSITLWPGGTESLTDDGGGNYSVDVTSLVPGHVSIIPQVEHEYVYSLGCTSGGNALTITRPDNNSARQIYVIAVPTTDSIACELVLGVSGEADPNPGGVNQLPDTGVGALTKSDSAAAEAFALLVVALLAGASGLLLRRRAV